MKKEFSELFRKVEEAFRKGRVPSRKLKAFRPPVPNPLPPSDSRWDEGLDGMRKVREAVASGNKEFSLGLWHNIRAKRERIKRQKAEGTKVERMRKPGSKGAPTAQSLEDSQTKELARTQVYVCTQCGLERSFRFSRAQILFCPDDNAPMMRKVREFSVLNDTEKAVWRHYYKGAKKVLRQTKGELRGALDGYMPSDQNRSKFGLLWRGTDKQEVDQLASKGRFRSNWTHANFPNKKRTYVAGNARVPGNYAVSNAAHRDSVIPDWSEPSFESVIPKARVYGISPNVLKRSDNIIRGHVGNYAQTAPIKGGISSKEVRVLLKPTGIKSDRRIDGSERGKFVGWKPTPLGDIQKRNFSRELTARLRSMKQFQSYAKTPEEERNNLLKTGIGALGVAAGLTGAGYALRGTVGAAQRADIARNAVNRVVRAQRAGKKAAGVSQTATQDASIFGQKMREKRVAGLKKQDKAHTQMVKKVQKDPKFSDGEKKAYSDSHAKWRQKNSRYTAFSAKLREFDDVILRQKRDTLSKLRDGASLAASIGTLGLVGYAGYRGHGIYKQASKQIPKMAETFHKVAPDVASHAKETMSKVASAAEGIRATAAAVKAGPIADGAPGFMKAKGSKMFEEGDRKRSVLLPLLGGAALGAGAVALPQVVRGARRIEKVAKSNFRRAGAKVGNVASTFGKTQDNVRNSTSIYADLGKVYREAKGGLYNILNPGNTWKETKAAFKAGMKGNKDYPKSPRPDWALSAKLRIKEFAQSRLETSEDGIPLNGRVAHDRFIKTIHESDLDRRDRNILRAGTFGGIAGALAVPKSRLRGGAIGAGLGAGSVLAIRAITNKRRDIYGDRPRSAKRAESLPAVAGVLTAAGLAAKQAKFFEEKKHLHPSLKAAAAGAIAGGALGAIPSLRVGSTLGASLKSIGTGAASLGGLVGGGVFVGNKVLGSPREGEAAPYTKRAAIGGALLGGVAGAGLAVASKKYTPAAKLVEKYAAGWRPAAFIKRAPLPAAVAAGTGVGAVLGADKAGDEGQQVDVINSIQNQKKAKVKTFEDDFRRYRPYDDVADARKQAFNASGVAATVGMAAAAGLGYRRGAKVQFRKSYSYVKGAVRKTKAAQAGERRAGDAFQKARTQARSWENRAKDAETRAADAEAKSYWKQKASQSNSGSNSSQGQRQGPPPRSRAKGDFNPHAGTDKASKWESYQAMKRKAAESPHEGERDAFSAGAEKYKAKHNLARRIKELKEFGFYNQPRRAGTSTDYKDKNGQTQTRWSRERGTFASPVRSAYGVEGELMKNRDKNGREYTPDFGQAQMLRGFYNEGKGIHKWGTRAARLAGDTGDVFAGNPRKRDASGRPQKREWEKSWFKNAAGAAAAGAGVAAGAYITKNTAWGRKNIQPRLKKIIGSAAKEGYRIFSSKEFAFGNGALAFLGKGDRSYAMRNYSGVRKALNKVREKTTSDSAKYFDAWAEYNGWDVRDPRGRSARVFAPGARARYRREKEWHEKKENRDLLWKATAGAVGLGGAAVGVIAARKHAGLPVNPFKGGGKGVGIFDMKGNPVDPIKKGPRYRSTAYPKGAQAKESWEDAIRRKGFHVVDEAS